MLIKSRVTLGADTQKTLEIKPVYADFLKEVARYVQEIQKASLSKE